MALKIAKATETYVPAWEGNRDLPEADRITMTYRRMSVGDYFALQKKTKVNLMIGITVDVQDIESLDNHWLLMRSAIQAQAESFTGIEVAGKAATAPKDVLETMEIPQLPLLAECFNAILSGASPSDEETKNLPPDSEPSSGESGQTVAPVTAT
jgi:hypothetical protein